VERRLRILVWPAGSENDATSQYRLLLPARALAAQCADVVIDRVGPAIHWSESWEGYDQPGSWMDALGVDKPDADVVVMQRPGRRWWQQIIRPLQAHGVKVVVDVDDRFDRIHPGNVAHGAYNPGIDNPMHAAQWIDQACKQADLVTCTTPALLNRYGYGHGVVLPNLVPEWYTTLNRRTMNVIGWTGSTDTHPGDLKVTRGMVGAVSLTSGWPMHVVGTGKGVRDGLTLVEEPSSTGWVPFDKYPNYYSAIGVAIVPLAQSPFNDAKSALKMCEAAALGVPVVASPSPDNLRMHKLGVGLIASSPNQWRRHLTRLTKSAGLRADISGRGREVMARNTYERLCGRWLTAWTSTVPTRSHNTPITIPSIDWDTPTGDQMVAVTRNL
jgi:hypothetical protein